MKGFIAIVLATALFLGVGASMAPPATAEVNVTMVDDGFLIENADIPDLSKVIQQNNLEKNFVDLIVKIYDTIDKHCEWDKLSKDDAYSAGELHFQIWIGTEFLLHSDPLSDYNKSILIKADTQIGCSKTNNPYRLAYVITNTDEKMCRYIFIEQNKKTLFIKSDRDIAKKSRDVIRRLLNTNDENIFIYDFDLVLAIEHRIKQL